MPPTDTPRELRPRPTRHEIDPVARALMGRHRDEVMASARRWAETPEDAEDAFQRGFEILLTKAPSTDPDHLLPWLKTVVKREAWAIRRQRERHTPPAPDAEDIDAPGYWTAHDAAVCFERLQLGAEALQRLKPHEVRAFVLKAEGLSYREICEETGWTYTKVNRALSEGRKAFADRLAGIESGAECDRLGPLLSALADGEARAEDMAALRPHLRTCLTCRARLRNYRAVPAKVAAVAPPVAVGYSLLDSARYLLDAAGGWLSARGAGLAARWHQAAELTVAHKTAAVAASVVVLGGGGAATVATVAGGPGEGRPVAPTEGRAQTSQPAPVATPGPATPAAPPDRNGRDTPRVEGPAAEQPELVPHREPPSGEFIPDSPAEPEPKPAQPPAPEPTGDSVGGEFSP